jgi:tetratricopeptide (TPR) repeat protein
MVKQVSWAAVIPQLVVMMVALLLASQLFPDTGLLWGASAFLLYSLGSRNLIAREHRAGMRLVRHQQFEAAIARFQKSLEFFDRYPWIDRLRAIFLVSPSAISYREMALANMAFCYSQIGRGEDARRYYERCLERFPDSGIASAALRMMDAASGETRRTTSP